MYWVFQTHENMGTVPSMQETDIKLTIHVPPPTGMTWHQDRVLNIRSRGFGFKSNQALDFFAISKNIQATRELI